MVLLLLQIFWPEARQVRPSRRLRLFMLLGLFTSRIKMRSFQNGKIKKCRITRKVGFWIR